MIIPRRLVIVLAHYQVIFPRRPSPRIPILKWPIYFIFFKHLKIFKLFLLSLSFILQLMNDFFDTRERASYAITLIRHGKIIRYVSSSSNWHLPFDAIDRLNKQLSLLQMRNNIQILLV